MPRDSSYALFLGTIFLCVYALVLAIFVGTKTGHVIIGRDYLPAKRYVQDVYVYDVKLDRCVRIHLDSGIITHSYGEPYMCDR